MKDIIDSLDKRIIVLDKDTRVLFASRRMLTEFNLKEEDVIGKLCTSLPNLCRNKLADDCACPVPEVFEHGKACSRTYKYTDDDGLEHGVEALVSPVFNGKGEVAKVSVLFEELSGSSNGANFLEQYAEGMTALFELTNLFLLGHEVEGVLESALDMIRHHYGADNVSVLAPTLKDGKVELEVMASSGLNASQIKGAKCSSSDNDFAGFTVLHKTPLIIKDFADEKDYSLCYVFEAMRVGSGVSVPMIVGQSVTAVLCILYQKSRQFDTADLWYLNVMTNALTVYIEKERSNIAHRESESFLESVLEGIGEGVVVIDKNMKIISANKGYLDNLKLPLEAVKDHYCYHVTNKSQKGLFKEDDPCAVKKVFEIGKPQSTSHVHYDSEGTEHTVAVNAYPIFGQFGEVSCVVETVVDVTEKAKLEHDLEKRVHELEQFYDMAVGRELRMIELKEEIERLNKELAHGQDR